MFKRALSERLRKAATEYPVLCLTGPRQSGKTTLAQVVFKDYHYVSLEDLDEREFASQDPRGFLARFKSGVVLDEAQRVPGLLSYIQTHVDREKKPGQFVLTGSHQFNLLHNIGQTLAGRALLLNLFPLSLSELLSEAPLDPYTQPLELMGRSRPKAALDTILTKGLYPRIHDQQLDAYEWLGGYCRTYAERDVREILRIGDLAAFQKFLRLCAGRSAQLLNLSSLANDCGISHTSAKTWLSVLEASCIVFLLRPHHANFSKRLIKSPKLYFLDSGLMCYLLRIRDEGHLRAHPLRGEIFETFVVSEIVKSFVHAGEEPPLYFWRDHTGHEVDVILDLGTKLIPVEIKSGQTFRGSFLDGLKFYTSLASNAAGGGVLVYGGIQAYEREGFRVKPWWQCS